MAAKKYYAVRRGKKVGLFTKWEECKNSVEGYPGAEYKGFVTKEEARDYLQGYVKTEPSREKNIEDIESFRPKQSQTLVAYVDGSYEHSLKKYAFGCIFLLQDGRIYRVNGSGNQEETAKQRNVAGEMLGAMYASGFAVKNGFQEIEIRYDYEGIEKWVTGAWQAKTDLTKKYRDYMSSLKSRIKISFTKVAAHSNVYFNEMADQLAKEGLTQTDTVPAIYSLEELTPWNVQE